MEIRSVLLSSIFLLICALCHTYLFVVESIALLALSILSTACLQHWTTCRCCTCYAHWFVFNKLFRACRKIWFTNLWPFRLKTNNHFMRISMSHPYFCLANLKSMMDNKVSCCYWWMLWQKKKTTEKERKTEKTEKIAHCFMFAILTVYIVHVQASILYAKEIPLSHSLWFWRVSVVRRVAVSFRLTTKVFDVATILYNSR